MRKKNEINRFAKWCFSRLGLRPIPIKYAYATSLIDPSGTFCFGCYVYDDDRPAWDSKIWIAYNHTRIGVMSFLAHEIWHYYQNVQHGIKNMDFEKCEKDADEASDELLTLWLIRGGYVNGQP